jgi:predicted RNA binding protein YcfA (HicA-like mRNA interferase family)
MTVLSINSKELQRKILEHGGHLERQGAKHRVYAGPYGRFTVPHSPRGVVTGAMVRSAAHALGTTTRDLLR